jgi:flagellar protein FlbD
MDIINNFIGRRRDCRGQGGVMVEVVGINGEAFLINAALIEKIEFIPETKITLTTGKYYLVKDSKEEIINKIITFNQKIIKGVTAAE